MLYEAIRGPREITKKTLDFCITDLLYKFEYGANFMTFFSKYNKIQSAIIYCEFQKDENHWRYARTL